MNPRALFALALALLAACSSRGTGLNQLDAADIVYEASADVAPLGPDGGCVPGSWQCVSGTRSARQCDPQGNLGDPVDCGAAGQVCAPGLGCATCVPSSFRCNPDDPELTQQCSSDGTAYTDGARCDGPSGEHCVTGHCARPCDAVGSDYLGCEYWPVVTPNGGLATEFSYAVAVANTQSYPVDITVEGGALTTAMTARVAPNDTTVLNLPWVRFLSQNVGHCCAGGENEPNCVARSTRLPGGAYHLRASGPVAAYQFNPLEYQVGSRFSFTADASLLLPQNVLGQQYLVFSYPNTGPPFSPASDHCIATAVRGGFVAISSAQTDTAANMVHVHTTSPIWDPQNQDRTLPAGDYDYLLQRSEVLVLVSQGLNNDLTGTLVTTSAPAAVYSGHDCAAIPFDRPACDHLEEQLFPLVTWGTTYAVSPVRYRDSGNESSLVRIMAQRDGTTLSFDGIATPAACSHTLNRGQFCELQTTEGFQVTGSAAIAVGQYMPGLGAIMSCQCSGTPMVCPSTPECRGDPSLLLEPPVEQFRASYRILVPASYVTNFLTLVGPPDVNVLLDGVPVTGPTSSVGANLVARVLTVSAGSHDLRSDDAVGRFGVKVYGVAPYTSYAYPGGLDLAAIAPL